MDLQQLQQRAREIRGRYAQVETAKYGREWTTSELALGFVGDVGDLAKLIQAIEGMRDIPDARNKVAHELADCLWSVLVLADRLGVDLGATFLETMDEVERRLVASSA